MTLETDAANGRANIYKRQRDELLEIIKQYCSLPVDTELNQRARAAIAKIETNQGA